MAVTTKIIVQQILNIDDTKATASKFPRYTVTLGNSISSITASELVSSIEAAAKSAAAAKDSEIAAKTSELNAKDSEQEAAISAGASEASATQSATSATQSAASADRSAASAAAAKVSETNAKASETKAKTSETNAKTSETNAKASETKAKASETNAKTSKTNAAASAAAAKISETNAKISETNAAESAADSKGFRDEAEAFAAQAAASAAAAKVSETKAKTSETNAKASETKAKASETNAASSATSASQSVTTIQGLKSDVETLKSDTQTIKDSAVAETTALKSDVEQLKIDTQTIKDNAVSETTALKDAAAASATKAGNSATEAGKQAGNAGASATAAKKDADRAKTEADRAEAAANNAPVGALAEVIPTGENVLNYIAVAGQSGYYSSGDGVTHIPPVIEGWWTYNFHCHGVDINGAAQYGVLKAVGLSGSSWINVLDGTGNWKGWVKNLNEKSIIPITQGGTGATTVAKARENLLVDQVDRSGDQTMLWAPDKDTYLFVYSAGDWGVYDRSAGVRKSLPIASGGTGADNVAQARRNLGVGIDQDVTFNSVWAKAYYGQGGPWAAAVIKEKSQQASDGANLLSYIENSWFGIQNYVAGAPGQQYQYVWSFNTFGGNVVWYSMRNDNGFYTPEGRCAIQGSDVRIKDRFEPPKPGAWDRVKQIGIIEFKYKGNDVQQRGYLAQQMSEIDNTYTFFGGQATDENGEVFEIMNVNDRAVMSDVITVVQQLQDELLKCKEQMEYMQRELNALRSSK